MANEQNLIPNEQRTPKERRENASKAGKASAKKRAERKKFNELFNNYLDKKVTNEQIKEQMLQFGFTDEECTNKNASRHTTVNGHEYRIQIKKQHTQYNKLECKHV